MKPRTISEIADFYNDNPKLLEKLKALLRISHDNKKAIFSEEEIKGYEELVTAGFLHQSPGNRFEFDFKLLEVCYVLMEIAQERLGKPVPADVLGAVLYGDEFFLSLRQPKLNYSWYLNLELEFKRYLLVWVNQIHGVDVSTYYRTIDEDMLDAYKPLRSFGIDYQGAFPYLNNSVEEKLAMIGWLNNSEKTKYVTGSALSDLGKQNPEEAATFFEYAKINGGLEFGNVLHPLIITLYETDPKKYFAEAVSLFHKAPEQASWALAWLNYKDPKQIVQTFELMESYFVSERRVLGPFSPFYTHLIENKHTPKEIRAKCVERVRELLKIEKTEISADLIHRIGWIDGYDEEKLSLLPQVLQVSPHYLKEIFRKFQSAAPLFDFLKKAYQESGVRVNFNLLNEAFSDLQHSHPEEFEEQLLATLTDDIAIIRLAGLEVLRSRYGGIYDVNFLKLEEAGQLRALTTLLPHPHSIEDLFPQIFKLRNSSYPSVQTELSKQLKELIWAYDHHLLDMVKKHSVKDNSEDDRLIAELEQAFTDYSKIKEAKEQLKEFDPYLNQLDDLELYYQLEREQQAMRMEQVGKMSFFAQIAKDVSIIRGSAFKAEASKEVILTSEIKTSILLDMRYYRNPDRYELDWQKHLNDDFNTSEEVTEA